MSQHVDTFVPCINSYRYKDETTDWEVSIASKQESLDFFFKNESGKVTNNWPDFTYVYEEATQSIDPDDYAFTQLNRSDMTEAAE